MEKYEFLGLKLKPVIFKKLLVLLFDGKQFSRQTAIKTIVDYHIEHGGIVEDNRNVISCFKAATNKLQKADVGLVNKGYGTWALHYEIKDSIEIIEEKKSDDISYTVDESLGSGANTVYVYYYDVYKLFAESHGKSVWACKVGRTDRDPIQRVISQAGTCYPELPHIALTINCDDSIALETALHSILKYQNKWMKDAPGTEWFITSPQEIKELYKMLLVNPLI